MRLAITLSLYIGLTTAVLAQNDYIQETQAQFPGGVVSMKRFLKCNTDTSVLTELDPFFVTNNDKSVVCSFMIDTLGCVTNIRVEQKVHPVLDKEAIRVIGMMPRWEPAKRYYNDLSEGKPIPTQWNVPVSFDDPYYNEAVYRKVDEAAEFTGTTEELMQQLNIPVSRYLTPAECTRFKDTFGDSPAPRTVCTFTINPEGEIRRLKVLRSSEPELDRIALHVIAGLPGFIPAEINGEKVCTNYTLSAFFHISEASAD